MLGRHVDRQGPVALIALVLALFAFGAGNLDGGATAWGATLGALTLVVIATTARDWSDPWWLGGGWRWAPWGLVALVAVSLATSVVPRAGIVGVVLLPAFVLAPAAVARRLAEPTGRRRELVGLAALVITVAGWSLAWYGVEGTPRPARPLGHHNLLALFLVTLLPVVAVAGLERTKEKETERKDWVRRGVAGGAVLLGIGALAASRSLSGGLALGVAALIVMGWGVPGTRRRRRRLLALLVPLLLCGVWQGERVRQIVRGEDSSARARGVYVDAGLRGIAAAPWFGQGPGSTPWTIAAFARPVPGVTPPGEVLGELHSWPVAVGYELGLVGLAGVVLALSVFVVRRWAELRAGSALGVAGLAGLAAALVAALGTAEWRVTALPLALAVTMGAALAGGGSSATRERRSEGGRVVGKALAIAYVLLALLVLPPKLRAQFRYERAVTTGDVGALEDACRLDPAFPLYAARRAWLQGDAAGALAAARLAGAVPALWAGAADLGVASGAPWARSAALTLTRLDPLLPVGPWLALTADPEAPDAPDLAAHALAADPRLGAALWWRGRAALRDAASRVLEELPGLDVGWRQAASREFRSPLAELDAAAGTARLGLDFDADPAGSVSLIAFRRAPWPSLLAPVRVEVETAARLAASLPSAARQPAPSAQVLVAPWAPRDAPQELWKTLRKLP